MLPRALHPVIVSARLHAPLSRCLWLVTWILAVQPPDRVPAPVREH